MNRRNMEIKTTKAMGLAYLARALSDFKAYPIQADKECNQILSLVVHGINVKNWKFVINEIYYMIEFFLSGGIYRNWEKKAAMIASLDFEGSRTANLHDKLNFRPHIHASIILPHKEGIDAESLEWYLNANRQNIGREVKLAMLKKGISSADQLDYDLNYFSIHVDIYHKKQNVCVTNAISYQIKATSFLNCSDLISPVVHPFDLKMMKLKGKPEKREHEKERAHRLLQDLIFDPRRYLSGKLFEIDLRHKIFLMEYQKLTSWSEAALLDLRTEAIRYIGNENYDRLGEMAIAIKRHLSAATKNIQQRNAYHDPDKKICQNANA